jgi:hypothetical protein
MAALPQANLVTILARRLSRTHWVGFQLGSPEGSPLSSACRPRHGRSFRQTECAPLALLLRQSRPRTRGLPIYVNTARATLEAIRAKGPLDELAAFGVTPVVYTCNLCHGDRSGAGWSDHDQFGQVGALCAWQHWLSGGLWRARGLHSLRFGGPRPARLRVKREGRAYAAGSASGLALVLSEPLSLFGGIAVETGRSSTMRILIAERRFQAAFWWPPAGEARPPLRRFLPKPSAWAPLRSASFLPMSIRSWWSAASLRRTLYGRYVPLIVCPIEGIGEGDLLAIRCDPCGSAELEL